MVVGCLGGVAGDLGLDELLLDLRQTSTGGDELTDDDVLLQAGQRVDLALDSGLGQDTGGLLEGRSGQEGVGSQTGLGDAKQDLAGLNELQISLTGINAGLDLLTSRRFTMLPMIKSLEPESSMRTLRIIWRTMTSICLSLMSTPCRR